MQHVCGIAEYLYDACVPPTAFYGCEVWGLRELPAGELKRGRDALGTSHLFIKRTSNYAYTCIH